MGAGKAKSCKGTGLFGAISDFESFDIILQDLQVPMRKKHRVKLSWNLLRNSTAKRKRGRKDSIFPAFVINFLKRGVAAADDRLIY